MKVAELSDTAWKRTSAFLCSATMYIMYGPSAKQQSFKAFVNVPVLVNMLDIDIKQHQYRLLI